MRNPRNVLVLVDMIFPLIFEKILSGYYMQFGAQGERYSNLMYL